MPGACGNAVTAVSGMGGASATGGGGGIRGSSVARGTDVDAVVVEAPVPSDDELPPRVRNTPKRITSAAAAPPTANMTVLFDFRGMKSASL